MSCGGRLAAAAAPAGACLPPHQPLGALDPAGHLPLEICVQVPTSVDHHAMLFPG